MFDVTTLKEKIGELEIRMGVPEFWDNQALSQKVISELKDLKDKFQTWSELNKRVNDAGELISIVEQDAGLQQEIARELQSIGSDVGRFEIKVFLSDKFDRENAIVSINSGAGGTEACDWANMLFRMYGRWADAGKYKLELVDILEAEEAGIKNVTFIIRGLYAYGYLKAERGVHRLVRISPFDSNKRRHTSFASVDVIPEISEDVELEINPEDLKIDTFRSSGRGGQHVNVTDSAVRITHIPSGIIVSCQSERSQHQNKQTALRVLRSRLYQKLEEEQKKELEKISGDKKRIEWGSQIRSYVLYPYLMVKDHRTDYQTSNANAVLDGDLNGFMEAYLRILAK
ncbi:MAG: peptide chain release factor 2 [Candidatus Omnitrophica bacterium]|nr:peptide chain release factor 2 [Candidatus Omnitrophota bacterium]